MTIALAQEDTMTLDQATYGVALYSFADKAPLLNLSTGFENPNMVLASPGMSR